MQHAIKFKQRILLLCLVILMTFSPATSQNISRPNILVILLDDARYDSFGPNGGPDFFNTPSINSIAQEGANFKNYFVTTAVCGPSRSTIYTGLYTHHHGCVENGDSPNPGLTYVSSILQDAGYYTGFIGKWLYNFKVPDTPVGFDYWAVTDSFKHIDPVITFNDGSQVQYYGHDSEIYTDLGLDFWNNKAPTCQPWLLFMSHRVPHTPFNPREQDTALYDNEVKPFPSNFDHYQKNFPSHLYPGKEYLLNSDSLTKEIERYFETCYSAEASTDSLLTWLSNHHLLDSTLIIFTSDNGYLFGEHKLHLKLLAYEESMHVPLFIRYPPWFAPGTVIENEITANIDLAPTLLEAAGIRDTFQMDGESVHSLANGTTHRPYFFFEHIPNTGVSWEAVRSLRYKYIYHFCSNQTEEFFDLLNDPGENTNLIFDPAYDVLIDRYRFLRDSLRIATDDTVNPSPGGCSLNSFFYADADQDGFGNYSIRLELPNKPSGYVADKTDCDDANASVHPGANDICNGIDDNCNHLIDENAIIATITPAGNVSVCEGTEVLLTANGGAGISYQWIRKSKNLVGETNQSYSTKKDASYSVLETNTFDCAATSAKTKLTVLAVPAATIIPLTATDLCFVDTVILQANGGTAYTYQWKKGSKILAETNQVIKTTKSGTYKVTITNQQGCSKTSNGFKVTNSCKEGEISPESATMSVF
ncbi:MAG: sulfatase-like hydrolase/transferase, partial [Chitinophagales bacterium]